MKFCKFIVIATACFALGGCAVVTRQPISQSDRQKISSDKLVVNTNQHEIKPDLGVDEFAAASLPPADPRAVAGPADQPSLLGMLIVSAIDNHRSHKIEDQIAPIRSALNDYDFMPTLQRALTTQLQKVAWLKLNASELKYNLSNDAQSSMVQRANGKSILFVDANYMLNKDFTALFVSAHVRLSRKDANNQTEKLYENYFVYVDHLDPSIKHREPALPLWTAKHGARLKVGLKLASEDLAWMIALDIRNPKLEQYASLTQPEIKFKSDQDIPRQGKVIAKLGEQTVLRTADGSLYAVNANSLLG